MQAATVHFHQPNQTQPNYQVQHHPAETSHSLAIGYVLWLLGFFGAHRFYYGRPVSGIIYCFTFGLFFVGWILDLFFMPVLASSARRTNIAGPYDHNVAWLLHSCFLVGLLGLHRFYLGKWFTGLLWLCTGGLLGIGFIYDWITLNDQVNEANYRS
jgi:TM2 domain-containing membrane protein YozV